MNLKKAIKKAVPLKVKEFIVKRKISLIENFMILTINHKHEKALKKVKAKTKIKVAFFVIHSSVWKYDILYKLFDDNERFEPIIVICPYITNGQAIMLKEMELSYNFFENKNYKIKKTYNEATDEWLDVKAIIQPDIVFFTNPHNLTRKEYYITNWQDTLTCYVPYGFKVSHLYKFHFDLLFQNLLWKFFLETDTHQTLSIKISRNQGRNTLVTGYPGMDTFLVKDYVPNDVWKIKNKNIKRIIWAPHHTISGKGVGLDYSTFLDYCWFMLELASRYKDKIQISFKPHPILRSKLNESDVWGKIKTDQYYETWKNLENGQLDESDYMDLFMTSDAMIHDSGSFLVEYLYTGKPVMFLVNDDNITDRFNEIGKKAFDHLYLGKGISEINEFIEGTVINEIDIKEANRISFFKSLIKPPNDVTASENIYNSIIDQIENK